MGFFPYPNSGNIIGTPDDMSRVLDGFFASAVGGIDQGWVAVNTIRQRLLATGAIYIDHAADVSQNLNTQAIRDPNNGAEWFPPRTFSNVSCTLQQKQDEVAGGGKQQQMPRVRCNVRESSLLHLSCSSAPIWHFPGPTKLMMSETYRLLRAVWKVPYSTFQSIRHVKVQLIPAITSSAASSSQGRLMGSTRRDASAYNVSTLGELCAASFTWRTPTFVTIEPGDGGVGAKVQTKEEPPRAKVKARDLFISAGCRDLCVLAPKTQIETNSAPTRFPLPAKGKK